jgi:hypothetical protein
MNYLAKSFDKFVVLTDDNLKNGMGTNLVVISNPLSFLSEESSFIIKQKGDCSCGKQEFKRIR